MNARRLSLIIAATLAASTAHAATNGFFRGARAYVQGGSFVWEEFMDGDRLLKESGGIYGVGGDVELGISKRLSVLLHAGIFGGDVDYDGAIQNEDGSLTPAKTTTSYAGGELAANLATHIPVGSARLTPHAGFGLRAWERTLDSSYDSRYIGNNGYIEDWVAFHAALGATLRFPIAGKVSGFVTGEVRIPLATYETVDLSNVGGDDSIDLEPKAKVSVFAEGGVRYRRFFASLFVETMDFEQSDTDDSGTYLQPDSEMQLVGGRAGVEF